MRRTAILVGALLVLAPGLELSAQAMPDFSGTWTRSGAAAAQGAQMAGLGQSATITQTDSTMTVSRSTQFGEITSVYNLDGSSRTNTLTFGDFSVPQVSTATWAEGTLTIVTSVEFNGNAFETSLNLSMNSEGQIVAVASLPDFGGGGGGSDTGTYTKG